MCVCDDTALPACLDRESGRDHSRMGNEGTNGWLLIIAAHAFQNVSEMLSLTQNPNDAMMATKAQYGLLNMVNG